MNDKYMSLMQVSRLLQIPYWRLLYAEAAGYIPEPLRVACKRAYTDKDIELIRAHFTKEETDGGADAVRDAQEP